MLQPEGSFQSSLYHCIFLTDVGETRRPLLVSKICLTLTVFFSLPLLFLVYVWPSLFPPSPQEFSDCHFTRHARGRLLGLGDEQRVRENEEMSLLRLQARLQLRLGVAQEQAAWTLGQETLDQGTGLRADWRQAAFPGGKNTKEHTHKKTNKVKFFKDIPREGEFCGLDVADQQVLDQSFVFNWTPKTFSLRNYCQTTFEQSTDVANCVKPVARRVKEENFCVLFQCFYRATSK